MGGARDGESGVADLQTGGRVDQGERRRGGVGNQQGQSGHTAGHAAAAVGDDHPVIAGTDELRVGQGQATGHGVGQIHAIELPLIAERPGANGLDGKGHGRIHKIRKARRGRHDGGHRGRRGPGGGDKIVKGGSPTAGTGHIVNGRVRITKGSRSAQAGGVAMEINAGQGGTGDNRIVLHAGDTGGNKEPRQPGALHKGIRRDVQNATGNGITATDLRTFHQHGLVLVEQHPALTAVPGVGGIHVNALEGGKGNGSNVGDGAGKGDTDQAVTKRVIPDGGQAVGQREVGQTGTIIERLVPEAGDAAGDRGVGQSTATGERRIPDGRHAVGNNDAGERGIPGEGIGPDVGDGHSTNPGGHQDVSRITGVIGDRKGVAIGGVIEVEGGGGIVKFQVGTAAGGGTAGHQRPTIGQTGQGLQARRPDAGPVQVPASGTPGVVTGIIGFRSDGGLLNVINRVVSRVTTGNQHLSVGQEQGGVIKMTAGHRAGGRPGALAGIIHFCAGVNQTGIGTGEAAGDQHVAIRQPGGGGSAARGVHVPGDHGAGGRPLEAGGVI